MSMSKMKTVKAIRKRFAVKRKNNGHGAKSVKIIKRTNGQDHFNARESGKVRRNKRSDRIMSETVKQTIMRAMPYA